MNFRKTMICAAIGVAALAGLAYAQISAPQVQTLNPTSDLVQVVPGGQPAAQSVYTTPAMLAVTGGYYKSTPPTGFTYTFGNTVRIAAFTPASTISSGTITMPATPSDGQQVCFFSTNTITTLTVSANTGQTISGAVTTLTANGRNCYLYGLSNATWNRSQ